MKTALVTGDRGFIGRHVRAKLEADGWTVRGADVKAGVDARSVFASSIRYDLVVHCAAVVGGRMKIEGAPLEVATDLAIDSDFFQYVARTRPRRAIYFSSSAAYPIELQTGKGALAGLRLTEDLIDLTRPCEPDAIYGWVKLTGERVAQLVADRVTVFRPFSGYGSDQDLDYPFPSFVDRAARALAPFEVWGPGTQRRDWIHIDDLVESIVAAVDIDPCTVNLCTGIGYSAVEVAELAASAAGYEPRIELDPDRPVGVMSRIGDPTLMLRRGFPVPRVTLIEGVLRAVADRKRQLGV